MLTQSFAHMEVAYRQISKYVNDFNFYFRCLKAANEMVHEVDKKVEKAASINLNKKRSRVAEKYVANLIKRARFINKDMLTLTQTEMNNLKNIITYLNSKKEDMGLLYTACQLPDSEAEAQFKAQYGDNFMLTYKKLTGDIKVCENYLIPKNQALIDTRQAIQERLEFKFNQLPAKYAHDEDYDFKFGEKEIDKYSKTR